MGYGGLYPRTLTGQVIAMACCLLGLCYTCMPLTIFGSTFYTYYLKQKQDQREELTVEEKTHARRRFGAVVKFISAGMHIRSTSNVTQHKLSERELQVYEYTYRCKLPTRVAQMSLERVQEFKVCAVRG